jgi:hypothetical protein
LLFTTCQSCKNTNPSCQKWNHYFFLFKSDLKKTLNIIYVYITYHKTIFFLFFNFFFTILVYFFVRVLWTILYEYCYRQVQMIRVPQGRIQRLFWLKYGVIFSIIDGTNCSPKAVLAWRLVNLVFILFSV